MDILWTSFGSLFMLAGLAGCFLPIVPGPPMGFVGFLMLQLTSKPPFSTRFLLTWAAILLAVTLLDYLVPVYGTKKFGGTQYGIWGCTIGIIAGIWFGPIGIIVGPFLGALIGELLANQNSHQALKAAFGSFIGFVLGTLIKLVTCFVMIWYFVGAVVG
jgi:uncharacterized protein